MDIEKISFKLKWKRDFCKGFIAMVDYLLLSDGLEDDEKLIVCVLNEIATELRSKTTTIKPIYKITVSASQSIAIQLAYLNFFSKSANKGDDFTVQLLGISNTLNKKTG